MICVFDVIEGPARGKRFWVRPNQLMEVGRISTADFSVPVDQHMSRYHFIVEATSDAFRVRDVGSANGTFVNNAKVTALELCSGDRIRAGSTTLEVSLIGDNDSPHARDGLSLGSYAVVKPPTATAPPEVPPQPLQQSHFKSDKDDTGRFPSPEHLLAGTLNPSHFDKLQTRHAEHWLATYFSPSPVSNLYWEATDFRSLGLDLTSLLQRFAINTELNFVINRSQLGKFERTALEDWIATNRVEGLTATHYLLENDGSDEVWEFISNSLYRDALICIGSTGELEKNWLRSELELFRYPSLLAVALQSSTPAQRAGLLQNIEFLMFERDRGGKLGLLCGDLSQ